MEEKSEVNRNKIILGEFNCTIHKMDRDGRNKKQIIYRCGSSYALSKLTAGNGLENQERRENPYFSEVTHYDRFFLTQDPG